MSASTRVGRWDRRTVGLTLWLVAAGAGAAPAQAVLNQFSYDNLRLSAVQLDIGLLGASQLQGTVVGGLRLDYGLIAPKVRVLLGLSYFKSQLDQETRDGFEQRIRNLIDDPTNDYTINVGRIYWSAAVADLDLQYVLPQGRTVTTYLGLGVGIHFRNGSGTAIAGTFVEDALDEIAVAGNISLGGEVRLSRAWRWTWDTRGVVSTGLTTIGLRIGIMYRWAEGR